VKLYTYFRSSAAYRVRIALNLKGLSSEMIPIHLLKQGGLNKKPEYRAVNPQMRVPALQLDSGDVLIQSLAIIEYLDEVHPKPPLLPRDPLERAKVRALAQMIACDIHPLNNTSPLRYLKHELGQDQTKIGFSRASSHWRRCSARRPMPSATRSPSPTSAWCRRSPTRGA